MYESSVNNNIQFLFKRDYSTSNPVRERKYLFKSLETQDEYFQKDLVAHFGCVNALDFSNDGKLMVSGGDDKRVLLWNVQETLHNPKKPTPKSMRAQHTSNIFTLAFDSKNKVVFSGGNDDNVIQHDLNTGDPLNYFLHERPVYGVSVDPTNDNVFSSACDDGRILIFDTRDCSKAVELAVKVGPFHAVMFNPCDSRLVASANSKDGIALWDTRHPRKVLLQYEICYEGCMSIRFNKKGSKLLGLRRRLPPILYNTHCTNHIAQFDQPGYYNSCTMKSCCFAGDDDEFVLSGSDDFNLYMWRIPQTDTYGEWVRSSHHTLVGHRSIVNQVRYNDQHCIIASSGVEKIIKFWSPFNLDPNANGDVQGKTKEDSSSRKVYTHEEYIQLVLRNEEPPDTFLFMNHDYSNQSTNEDPRMMAFFDSLVQRELEGWSSEDSSSTASPSRDYLNIVQRSRSNSSSSSSSSSSSGLDSSRRSTSMTPVTSTSSANSSSRSNNNVDGALLFAIDATLENGRFFSEEGLNFPNTTPNNENDQDESNNNPIKELIAQKRDRLMKLACTPPEKRKKKYLKRLRRKQRINFSSDEATSQSLSENEETRNSNSSSRLKFKRYIRISSGEENNSIDEASTSSGIRRKRKISETETPDSGIASSDTKTRFLKRNIRGKRCYRSLRVSSSSDDSD